MKIWYQRGGGNTVRGGNQNYPRTRGQGTAWILTPPRRMTAVELEKGIVTLSQSHNEHPVVFWLDIQAYLGTRIGQIPLF